MANLRCPNCEEGHLSNPKGSRDFACDSCDTKVVHEGNAFVME